MKYLFAVIISAIALKAQAQCSQYAPINIGSDTVICQGQTVTFSVPTNTTYDDFIWWNGAFSNAVTISQPDTVILQVLNLPQTNLIVNGDFESGNTGFSSSYIYGTGGSWGLLSNAGQFAIATSPSLAHNNFISCADHTTTGPGNMIVVNGAGTANTSVWCQTVTVQPNQMYNFSAWVSNALASDPNVAQLQFTANGVQLGSIFTTPTIGCTWQEFNNLWYSGSATSAQLCIVNQNFMNTGGNDFMIDDISFKPVCVRADTIIVTYDTATVSAGPDIAFCENEPESFTASASFPNATLVWETTAIGSSLTPTTSGTYTVSTLTPNGCLISDSAVANITMMPWDFDLVESQATSCGVNDGAVYITTTGTFVGQPIYTWNGPGVNNPTQFNATAWTNRPAGWYYISIESQGCFKYDSVEVLTLNPPTAQISATPLTGYAPLPVSFTNGSTNGTSYVWDLGNNTNITVNDLAGQSTMYITPGTYTAYVVSVNGNCTDTAFVTIIVDEYIPPVIVPIAIEFPNVITPNNDQVNDVFGPTTALNIKSMELTIVNRWGITVFKSNTSLWDGKIDGKVASEGVYFYTYKATGAQNEVLEGHGQVTVTK